jgi:hypothetical protein
VSARAVPAVMPSASATAVSTMPMRAAILARRERLWGVGVIVLSFALGEELMTGRENG